MLNTRTDQILRKWRCRFGRHKFKLDLSHPDSKLGFHVRTCQHCPTSEVYASELGEWVPIEPLT